MIKSTFKNKEKFKLSTFGFTLIELLAVIVILAIIALIATPIVISIINNTKEESNKRSIDMYAKAIQNAIAKDQLDGSVGIVGSFDTTTFENELKVEYDGNVVCDIIEVYADGNMHLDKCKVNGEEVEYSYGVKLIPAPMSFATDSWETIAKAVREGNTSRYKVGETKEVSLTGFTNKEKDDETTYTVRIANTTTPEECNTEGFSQTACGFVIEFEDIIITHVMNSQASNKGGWRDSLMRTYVNNTIYNALPEELSKNIINTEVISGHGQEDTKNFKTIDKLYLLSAKEIWVQDGSWILFNYDTSVKLTRQLDYYSSIGVTTSKSLGVVKKYNKSAYNWWLRSASNGGSSDYFDVKNNGEGDINRNANDIGGVAPAFRIG